MLGILSGSGLQAFAASVATRREHVVTPYGDPSGPLLHVRLGAADAVFLQRHGGGHRIPPHQINYRANVWALHAAGVSDVVAVATVGGIRPDLAPGVLAVPDQIIDYTHGRAGTFHEQPGREAHHIDFTHPYCEVLRQRLLRAAAAAGQPVVAGGTYGATQGPRLETAAEINRMERDGVDMVGMTGMPEAALARELGLCYATLAAVVNAAAGRGASAQGIRLEALHDTLEACMMRVREILMKVANDGG